MLITFLYTFLGCNSSGTIGTVDRVTLPLSEQDVTDAEDTSAENPTDTEEEEEEETTEPPVAVISGPQSVNVNATITLSGEESFDPQGNEITQYNWACTNGVYGEGISFDFKSTEPGEFECALTVESSVGLQGQASSGIQVRDVSTAWTFMVFINGDNNLEDAGIDDINEMEIAGSTDDVKIVVQFDRSREYGESHGNWHGARRYLIQQDNSDQIGSTMLEDLGDVDSGDYNSVIDFVAWAADNYPAQKYALVLWDHGWSWYTAPTPFKGISSDDDTGNSISVAGGDLENLLIETNEIIGQKLEVLGMDACIMMGWEMANISIPYANYYVASQDYEGFDGWNYEGAMLELTANSSMNGEELGESIARTFIETGDRTQSVLDLSQLATFEYALDEVAVALMESQEYSIYYDSLQRTYSYDGEWGIDRDLYGILANIALRADDETLKQKAQAALPLLEAVITTNYTNGEYASGAYGLSIFSPGPYDWTQGYIDLYSTGSWAEFTRWDEMLEGIY